MLYSYFPPETKAYDIAHDGTRIILQSDIETVLIHTKIDSIGSMLDHLTTDALSIKRAAVTDHVSNQLGNGRGRINKLVAASITASINQISTVQGDYLQFFEDNAEPESNQKRALELLGSFLSTMTGVPSARDHRKVLEQIRLLKLDSSEIQTLFKKQNAENQDILQTFHYQKGALLNITSEVQAIYKHVDENADAMERMMTVISMTNKINAALESARIAIHHIKSIMESDKHGLLSKFVITNKQLSNIIDRIYLKRKKDLPIFAGPECHNYFTQPIAHSWVSAKNQLITTLLQIPIAPMHHKYELTVLDERNMLHADLPLAVVNKEMNFYRLLSLSDYSDCVSADNSRICQKREIRIMPRVGCSIKRSNCDDWAADAVYDISNSQILIILEKEMNATISCDETDSQQIVLPRKAVLTLNTHCHLETESFEIGKLSYRELKEISYNTETDKVDFDLEHKILQTERTDNLTVHKIMTGARKDIDTLIDNNNKIKLDLEKQSAASKSRWSTITGGGHPGGKLPPGSSSHYSERA